MPTNLPDDLPASSKYILMLEAACVAVEKYSLNGNLYQGTIVLKRNSNGAIYHISEADWTYLLPEAIDQVGKNCQLTPEQYDKLNALIGARKFRMEELGFHNTYPIQLESNIPTEHDPQMDEAEGK